MVIQFGGIFSIKSLQIIDGSNKCSPDLQLALKKFLLAKTQGVFLAITKRQTKHNEHSKEKKYAIRLLPM